MTAREGETGKAGGPSSDAELARRLDRLSRDLETEKQERAAAERPRPSDGRSYGMAFRLASEFVAGVLVGAFLGWGLDRLAGTSPWGLIGFLLLGFCAGILNVVRVAGRISAPAGREDGNGGF
jgi:ATP synthase protein I